MHFWIDKRSQACGFNGRNEIPSSLASGRRNKTIVAPVHRFQSNEYEPAQHTRRQHQSSPQPRRLNPQSCTTTTMNNSTGNESVMPSSRRPIEVEDSTCIDTNAQFDVEPHSQAVKLSGLIKYGVWASFGLIAVSVAVTRYYVNNQGTFEMLLLCTLGLLTVGLLGFCLLSICRSNPETEIVTVAPPTHRAEAESQEIMTHGEDTILPIDPPHIAPRETILGFNGNVTPQLEQPPPPYHIAILLPKTKEEGFEESPPPSYENAVR